MKRAEKLGEATINGKQVSIFTPPHDEPDFPWVDAYELARAFLPKPAAKEIVERTKRFSKGPSAVATTRNGGKVSIIMCHAMAQGLMGSIDDLSGHSDSEDGAWPDGGPAFQEYSINAGRFMADNWPLSFEDLMAAFKNQGGPFMRNAVV
ncbi:hypothetical protein [Paracoccus sp. SY]|uniref:hypothetical protein n=1 Tax=Paracoccus sp. SY TaxID=1330255 RepID=UPI000CD03A4E|nr:hypothetical protein [Paracoccus sp. SY]